MALLPSLKPPRWVDGARVDERRLQEYFHQKEHTLLLAGAAQSMKYTLESLPTSHADDGFLHFGDSLMLLSHNTDGLLQADIADQVPVTDSTRKDRTGASLSTGRMIASCPRNVLTISRVHDNDEFGTSLYVHFGQVIRLGASAVLSDDPLYLYASQKGAEDLAEGEHLTCLFSRASAGSHWRIVPGDARQHDGKTPVKIGELVFLENVNTGHHLRSERTVRMNNYGNEWRVWAAAPDPPAVDVKVWEKDRNDRGSTAGWAFVDMQWAEGVVEDARCKVDEVIRSMPEGSILPNDPAELLLNPVALANHELGKIEMEVSDYTVLLRVFPMLRGSGMHTVRKLRRMCEGADISRKGTLPARTFEGILSWVAVRLQEGEFEKLVNMFDPDVNNKDDPHRVDTINYEAFFRVMEPNMPDLRVEVVKDAYAKLESKANGGIVEVSDLQRNWNPHCHPEVQKGAITEVEAQEDFLRMWDITSADAYVTWEEFLDYYRDVSVAVEANDVFCEIVRCAWDM
mmetsp:Transcript_105798/g.183929  ORF Transcript_105798/g.183929 Transcript_105798/m.183929 type:complete len:514 (-) Transcript_105798:53-1594(-)